MRIAHALAILALGCTLGCTGKRAPNANDAKAGANVQAGASVQTNTNEQPAAAAPTGPRPGLLDPSQANEQAPEEYKVKLETTKGDVVIAVHRSWAPKGADRFYNLVKVGFFDDVAFFRAMENFMVQFGMNGNPEVTRAWKDLRIPDDPVKESNERGHVTFAMGGPNTRTTQVFVNFRANKQLDGMGFAPFGEVVEGMDVLDGVYKGYGDGPPSGKGPNQMLLQREGNAYLQREYPQLDWLKKATLVEG